MNIQSGLLKEMIMFVFRIISFLIKLIIIIFNQHIIEYILQFIENHSVLVGIVSSLLVSSFWFKKFLKQKRAEAFFGFYAKLLLRIKSLRKALDDNGQLNIDNVESGNIYSLLYLETYRLQICPDYKEPTDDELKFYKTIASKLMDTLIETDHNVYPPKANKNQWYESQFVIFSFCEFIANDEYQLQTNKTRDSEHNHISYCKKLIESMNYIQESIENIEY